MALKWSRGCIGKRNDVPSPRRGLGEWNCAPINPPLAAALKPQKSTLPFSLPSSHLQKVLLWVVSNVGRRDLLFFGVFDEVGCDDGK